MRALVLITNLADNVVKHAEITWFLIENLLVNLQKMCVLFFFIR